MQPSKTWSSEETVAEYTRERARARFTHVGHTWFWGRSDQPIGSSVVCRSTVESPVSLLGTVYRVSTGEAELEVTRVTANKVLVLASPSLWYETTQLFFSSYSIRKITNATKPRASSPTLTSIGGYVSSVRLANPMESRDAGVQVRVVSEFASRDSSRWSLDNASPRCSEQHSSRCERYFLRPSVVIRICYREVCNVESDRPRWN